MYQQLTEMLLSKYGHLSYSELTETLRKDGLGKFVDQIENDPHLMKLITESSHELTPEISGYGVIPSTMQEIHGIPVEYHGTFPFDAQACLTKCKGNCCKNKNYLMINISDIFRIISSDAAEYFDIHSTIDLFEGNPPFAELFYNEEYRFFFPYIRYLPTDGDVHTRPEDAGGSVCPFLRPITQVYEYHNKFFPQWINKDASGCMLMYDKPAICRLSPLGKNSGMITGNVTYEYLSPALNCPACETDVEIKVSEYVSLMISPSEEQEQERFHRILMSYSGSGSLRERDQHRFNEVVTHMYNIDRLLSEHGLGTEHRPQVDKLAEIVFAASHGDFSVYEQFIEDLRYKKNV
ncbi:MAG: hypothetical protein GY749_41330 [Desulfobacteraceae bacterium]|nr:hypothetical protein [Desulfobacteraceae bacterium]